MAKWKNAALITTLVLPLAITAGGEGVAVASQARPNQTTIKIHKQIRYDDTISGLSNDEKYFAWNHGSDEDGQHYFWGVVRKRIRTRLPVTETWYLQIILSIGLIIVG